MITRRQSTPGDWKREPLVWLLIVIPFSAVVMGVVIITLAIQSWSGLVVDDYYKKGKQINRVLARDKFAYELGLAASFKLATDGSTEVLFDPGVSFIPGDKIVLELVHATLPGLDQRLVLQKHGTHLLRGKINLHGSGRWNLYLHTRDWRLTGSLHYPQQPVAELLPNYFAD